VSGLDLRAPPERLVDERGQVAFGVFTAPLRRANLEEARVTWGGLRLPRGLARLRRKEWQHLALILPDAFVGVALVDAGYLRTSWCHVFLRSAGQAFEHARGGRRLALTLSRDLWDEDCEGRAPGYRIQIANRMTAGEHRLELAIEERGELPAVRGELRCGPSEPVVDPLVVSMPVGKGRFMYSHKVALPLEGELEVGGRRLRARPADSFAILDVHKAYYPHHTFWRWATLAGRDAAGRLIALNLTVNPNRDDGRINENAVWCGGKIHHLGPARFELDRARIREPWRVATEDGAVELRFVPEGGRSQNLRLGLVRSVFQQLYGRFQGRLRCGDEVVEVADLFGLCEDHDSLW